MERKERIKKLSDMINEKTRFSRKELEVNFSSFAIRKLLDGGYLVKVSLGEYEATKKILNDIKMETLYKNILKRDYVESLVTL